MSRGVRIVRGTMWGSVCLGIVAAVAGATGCRGGNEIDEPEAIRKVSPAAVSIAGAWSLFDRSTSSGFVPGAEPVRVALDHVEQISAIKAFGSAGYRLGGTAPGLPMRCRCAPMRPGDGDNGTHVGDRRQTITAVRRSHRRSSMRGHAAAAHEQWLERWRVAT